MNGIIAFANHRLGRYAVRTADGDYTIFELLGAGDLAVGHAVSGDFRALGGETYRTGGGEISVFAENYHCSRSVAERWVAGS